MKYPLWMFYDSRLIVITRGETQTQALQHASRNWRRGETITLANYLPINANRFYSLNHSPGWENRMPVWLEREKGLTK